ncbi:MAG: DUF4139 domain-containing protein [Planctomycetota bacterium]
MLRFRDPRSLRSPLVLALALLAAAPAAPAQTAVDPTVLDSRIAEVVVYGSTARLRRVAAVPGGGLYLLRGLPESLDRDSVRVRLSVGSVASVEVIERVQAQTSDARVEEVRRRLTDLLRQQRVLKDEHAMHSATRDHLRRVLMLEQGAHAGDVSEGRPNPEAWGASLAWALKEWERAQEGLRRVDIALEELQTQIDDAQAEQAGLPKGSVRLHDVVVDVVGSAPATLELEALVFNAGWQPSYDLRTAADARSVELVYRAKVWQSTGEDWNDVALLLSTAQPERGAQGPDPQQIRLRAYEPSLLARKGGSARAEEPVAYETAAQLSALGYVGEADADSAPPRLAFSAGVESHGLSVQFRLPRPESIPSRDRPSDVLVGRHVLEVRAERFVVPALDLTVWLRGLTRNASPWTLLPGRAAVHFGQDFLGYAQIEKPILAEQEFTLHLGADANVSCERVSVEDLKEQPGFLSKRLTRTEGWRITLENHGSTAATQPDGSVIVLVREAIPVPADDRIQVEVLSESSKPSRDERWVKDQDERGIRTWSLSVPRGGAATLNYRLRTQWPEGLLLQPEPVPLR